MTKKIAMIHLLQMSVVVAVVASVSVVAGCKSPESSSDRSTVNKKATRATLNAADTWNIDGMSPSSVWSSKTVEMSLQGIRVSPTGTTFRGVLVNRTETPLRIRPADLRGTASSIAIRVKDTGTTLMARPLPIRAHWSDEQTDIVLLPAEKHEFHIRHPVVMEPVTTSKRPAAGLYFAKWEIAAPVGANLPESSRAFFASPTFVSLQVVDE